MDLGLLLPFSFHEIFNLVILVQFGDDEFGHMLADILKKNGVDAEGVRFDPNARTALAFVTLKSNGEREFMFYRNPSADMLLTESELNLSLIKRAKIFHYGSISLISEPCRTAHLAAMRAAKQAGILLSYDPNVRLPLWPSEEAARTGIKSIWKEADFIKVAFLSHLCGQCAKLNRVSFRRLAMMRSLS